MLTRRDEDMASDSSIRMCRCGEVATCGACCAVCREKRRAAHKKHYQKRKVSGICTVNGCHEIAESGSVKCSDHQIAVQMIREARISSSRCTYRRCSEPLATGTYCRHHADVKKEKLRAKRHAAQ
jgi:hypothetical protein